MEVDTNFDPVALEKELVQLGKSGEEPAGTTSAYGNISSSENSESDDDSAKNLQSQLPSFPAAKVKNLVKFAFFRG